jgi:hypothetical protein
MAFVNLGSNQMVSEAEAATGGFTLQAGQSHGSSNLMMTKSAATTKYNLDATAVSGYTSNQLIPKSAWVSGFVGLSFQLIETTSQGWANTCPVAWSNPITKYTKTGLKSGGGVNFDDIYKIYNDVGCTSVLQIASKTFKALENGVYKRILGHSHSDTIEVLEDCSAPASYYAYSFSASRTSSGQSCLLTTYGTTWYSSSVQLDMGGRLFSNTGLTSPISGGNLWFHCQTGMAYQIDNSGYIIAYYDCVGI